MAGDGPPLIVGIDGSERSRDVLALAARLAESGQSMLLAHVHRFGQLETLVPGGEYEQLVREVAEATFRVSPNHIRDPCRARGGRARAQPRLPARRH